VHPHHRSNEVSLLLIDLFIFYITTLSVAQNILRRMNECYVNGELERMWKEAVVA
jgi:hypothetical protein